MKQDTKDRHAKRFANTDKSINSLATERRNDSQKENDDASSRLYATDDTSLQTPEEDEHDKSLDPQKSNTVRPSNDDLRETNADRVAGSDRAGTAERKPSFFTQTIQAWITAIKTNRNKTKA